MNTAHYPKPSEVRVTQSDAEHMMQDESIVVLLATEDDTGMMTVTYWPNDREQLPPWIRPAKAAIFSNTAA